MEKLNSAAPIWSARFRLPAAGAAVAATEGPPAWSPPTS